MRQIKCNCFLAIMYSNKKPNDEPSIDVIGSMKQKLPEYAAKCLMSEGYDKIEVLSTVGTSEKQGNSIEKIESFIEKRYADSSEHNSFPSHPFEFPPGHRVQIAICNFVRELKKSKEKLNPMSLCVAKIRLNPHKHSIPSTSKRMKVTSVDDEVDDTDIDGTEVFNGVQVAKQVRSSMKNG